MRVDHLLSKELLFFGCSCTLWLVEYASVMLPAFLIMKIVRVKHTPMRQDQVFEWRFVTHMLSVHS